MSFLKTLEFVFSDEFTKLQSLLLSNFSDCSMRDTIAQLERIAEDQENLKNSTAYEVQELKAVRTDINRIYKLCETLSSAGGRSAQMADYPLSKEDILQIVTTALEHHRNIRQEESMSAVRQGETIKNQISGIAAYSQSADKKLNDIYELLAAHNNFMVQSQSPWTPVQPEHTAALQAQLEQLQQELESYRSQCQVLLEENRTLKIQLQNQSRSQDSKAGLPRDINPYIITSNREKYLIKADDIEGAVSKLGNTLILEKFFEDISPDNPYKKMYERYKKKLKKCLGKAEEDELEDIMDCVVSVVHGELLKKIMVAIYRGKSGKSMEFEDKLLKAVNAYLESVGFYTRDNLNVGDLLKDEDFEDMEFIKDERATGKKHGEITEIELYPYYINYLDEDGKKRTAHTQGMMIVTA